MNDLNKDTVSESINETQCSDSNCGKLHILDYVPREIIPSVDIFRLVKDYGSDIEESEINRELISLLGKLENLAEQINVQYELNPLRLDKLDLALDNSIVSNINALSTSIKAKFLAKNIGLYSEKDYLEKVMKLLPILYRYFTDINLQVNEEKEIVINANIRKDVERFSKTELSDFLLTEFELILDSVGFYDDGSEDDFNYESITLGMVRYSLDEYYILNSSIDTITYFSDNVTKGYLSDKLDSYKKLAKEGDDFFSDSETKPKAKELVLDKISLAKEYKELDNTIEVVFEGKYVTAIFMMCLEEIENGIEKVSIHPLDNYLAKMVIKY